MPTRPERILRFRLMTWNMHKGIGGLDRRYDLGRIVAAIAAAKPDIVHLQEVDDDVPRSGHHRQSDELAKALAFEHHLFQPNVHLRRGRYGNAILSRYPIADSHSLDLTIRFKKKRGAQIATCRLPLGHGTAALHLVNMHLGLVEFEQSMQLRKILANRYFATIPPDEALVIAGDMNDLLGRLGRLWLLPEGFHRAGAGSWTFPSFLPFRALDQIHFRGALRLRHCFVERNKIAREASDHLPLVADFEIGAR